MSPQPRVAEPRIPLSDPSEASTEAPWDGHGIGGEFGGVLLRGEAGRRDLSDMSFRECVLEGADLTGTDLTRAVFDACTLRSVSADELRAGRSQWRHVGVSQLRVGALDLVDAKFAAVHLRGARIGRLDLRRGIVADVLIEDAHIEDLDLDEAHVTRLAFNDCRIGRLSLAGSVLKDVDLRGAELGGLGPVTALRGAVISDWQLQALAPALAADLGLRVL